MHVIAAVFAFRHIKRVPAGGEEELHDDFGVVAKSFMRVIYMTTNINVSGVTQKRLTLGFTNPSGGAFGLTAADGNIASGQFVAVRIVGAIS